MTTSLKSSETEFFNKQAKVLLKKVKDNHKEALRLIKSQYPGLKDVRLSHCQHIIALKYDFISWKELKNATPIQQKLAITMERIPLLTSHGIGIYSVFGLGWAKLSKRERKKLRNSEIQKERQVLKNNYKTVEVTVQWLQKNAKKIKTLNLHYTSYAYKHCAEHDIGYITNGTFIAAAIIAGFPYKIRFDSPNVEFGISSQSIKKWYKRINEDW